MKKNYKTDLIRVSEKLIRYIDFIQKRYKEVYGITLEFTEASNLLAKRAEEENLFK